MTNRTGLIGLCWLLVIVALLGCVPVNRQTLKLASPLPTPSNNLVHIESQDRTVYADSKLELAIKLDASIKIANPFDPDEVDLRVIFANPDGLPTTAPAFWDGSTGGWRVRFTPQRIGRWRATAAITVHGQQWTSESIAIDITATASNSNLQTLKPTNPIPDGFVRVHPNNPRYLAVETTAGDAHTFFPIGLNLGWGHSVESTLRDYERWFDALQANGGNTARLWMSSWAFGLEWDDTGLGDYTRRLDRAQLLDRVIELAETRGIYLIVVLINHGAFSTDTNPEWARNPYNAANGGPCATPAEFMTDTHARNYFKRRLRYIAARWAYSPHILAWEWWNEVELTRIETTALKPWLQEMSATLRQFDPYRHLSTISYAGDGDPAIWGLPEIDLLQRHEYNIGDPKWFKPVSDINALQRIPKKIVKPFLIGEFGYSPDNETDTVVGKLGIHFHNSLWASAMNGYAGGAMYWWWDSLVEPANLWPHYAGLAQFLQGVDLAVTTPLTATSDTPFAVVIGRKTPAGAMVWVRNSGYSHTLAQSRFLISKSTGESFDFVVPPIKDVQLTLNGLADGRYQIRWMDTLTGAVISQETLETTHGRLTMTIPWLRQDLAAVAMMVT